MGRITPATNTSPAAKTTVRSKQTKESEGKRQNRRIERDTEGTCFLQSILLVEQPSIEKHKWNICNTTSTIERKRYKIKKELRSDIRHHVRKKVINNSISSVIICISGVIDW